MEDRSGYEAALLGPRLFGGCAAGAIRNSSKVPPPPRASATRYTRHGAVDSRARARISLVCRRTLTRGSIVSSIPYRLVQARLSARPPRRNSASSRVCGRMVRAEIKLLCIAAIRAPANRSMAKLTVSSRCGVFAHVCRFDSTFKV